MASEQTRSSSGKGRRPGYSLLIFGTAALAYIGFLRPAQGLDSRSARFHDGPSVRPAAEAFGRSGHVRMRFALPSTILDYPIVVDTPATVLRYDWVPMGADSATDQPHLLSNGLLTPDRPGFYHLELRSDSGKRVVDGLALAVMVPFGEKTGASLHGYRIGFYRGERSRKAVETPPGFVQIDTTELDLPVSDHLRLGDFVTRDQQSTWPRYAAVDPRLLDKIELVFDEIESWYTANARGNLTFDVHSGFRTPLHNRQVARSAKDSRHQYGDAIDLAVDANRDGKVSAADTRLVALAVEIVERAHPDLVGGMGIYTRTGLAYVHIDTRGQRVRWRG